MKALNEAYKSTATDFDPSASYVFIVKGFIGFNGTLAGDMPIAHQFGYVKGGYSNHATANTIAHELSHGRFQLYHTFSDKYRIEKYSTLTNLMDYGFKEPVLVKQQWDLIHDPEKMLFAWAQDESEGALLSINDLVEVVRNANLNESKALQIIKDKCQQTAYSKFKIGDKSLTYIHIACGDLLENTEISNDLTTKNFDWNAKLNAQKIYIDPSEISKVNTVTKDGTKYIRYQFHELKYSDKLYEAPQLIDNVLFHFLVLESESADFEIYLYPKVNYFIESVQSVCQIDDEINGLNSRWCSDWSKCCNGDIDGIKDEKSNCTCEDGSKYGTNNCCFETSKYMIEQSGNTCGTKKLNLSVYFVNLVNTSDCRDGVNSNTNILTNEIILKAKKNIKSNIPAIAGVFYDYLTKPNDIKKPGNTTADNQKSPSNHFIVIVGYGVDKDGKEYFRFFDPASSSSGDNKENKLYFYPTDNLIKGKRANETTKNYILTEIRIP